jgi:hypothetical protein
MKFIALLFSVYALSVWAQKKIDFSADWANETHYQDGKDILEEVKAHDLSSFWISDKFSQNGVYGDDYWRIEFYLSDIEQDNADLLTYHVKGKDRHKGIVTPFEGTITITKATRYAVPHPMAETVSPISLVASYRFVEDPKSKYSGVFNGVFRSNFVYEPAKPEVFLLDNNGDDGYMNNTFVGVWTSKTGKQKKCIWGLERLPYTEDWDEGAGEIYVNKKYIKNGWQSYMQRLMEDKPVAKKDEWWK